MIRNVFIALFFWTLAWFCFCCWVVIFFFFYLLRFGEFVVLFEFIASSFYHLFFIVSFLFYFGTPSHCLPLYHFKCLCFSNDQPHPKFHQLCLGAQQPKPPGILNKCLSFTQKILSHFMIYISVIYQSEFLRTSLPVNMATSARSSSYTCKLSCLP